MTQHTALRLADWLEDQYDPTHNQAQAAVELRRLHAENERLHQINKSHEMKLSVRGYEIQIADLAAQRDALLEALKQVEPILARMYGQQAVDLPPMQIVRAAIKAVEEA